MADTKSDVERSRNMAAVRNKNTAPELRLRTAVWQRGLRFFTPSGWKRLTGKPLPGSPDLVFPSVRLAVFVDGCFWHGCPIHYTEPEDNRAFWQEKLKKNLARDVAVNRSLQEAGWHVLRLWEHDLRKRSLETTVTVVVDRVSQLRYLTAQKDHLTEVDLSDGHIRSDPDGSTGDE